MHGVSWIIFTWKLLLYSRWCSYENTSKTWIFLKHQKAWWNIRNREKFSYAGLKLLLGSFARFINVHTSYRSKCTWNDCVKKYLFRVFILTQFYLYLFLPYIYAWIIADKNPCNFVLLYFSEVVVITKLYQDKVWHITFKTEINVLKIRQHTKRASLFTIRLKAIYLNI